MIKQIETLAKQFIISEFHLEREKERLKREKWEKERQEKEKRERKRREREILEKERQEKERLTRLNRHPSGTSEISD